MWDNPRQMNALSSVLATIALIALAWSAGSWLVRQPAFAFREVVVEGPLERVNAGHVEAVIRDELVGTFFTMDLDRSRAALARVPWARSVALRRQWPKRLTVTIEEQVPLARWNDAALINTYGELFVADYDGELPQFSGPDARAADVAARYREWRAALAPLGLSLTEIVVSPRGGWHLAASAPAGPFAVELGRDDPSARLHRFIAAYGRTIGALEKNGTGVDRVDLRYRNGFAAHVPGFKERLPKKAARLDSPLTHFVRSPQRGGPMPFGQPSGHWALASAAQQG
jgi:cell division protein FtsQ